jgi:hypothetical protein
LRIVNPIFVPHNFFGAGHFQALAVCGAVNEMSRPQHLPMDPHAQQRLVASHMLLILVAALQVHAI